jgi:hypothetical protein
VAAPGEGGLGDPGYGNGAAVGDVDGDGDVDVYVANVGRDSLFLNGGSGVFQNTTERSGIRDEAWSSAAVFLDHDRDGDLDLYVVHYVVIDPTRVCRPRADAPREYCGPGRYQSVPDTLYRNRGDGTFEDVSKAAGIVHSRAGLGVVCADLTGDGWVDIYVANDRQPNLLYVNRRDGTFADEALERGLALSGAGNVEASMGVALGDVNADSAIDILVTNLAGETATLYIGSPRWMFEDHSTAAGLGAATLKSTGWGCGFADLDNDGDLDLPIVNGRIERGAVHPGASLGPFWSAYAEPNQLFLNDGTGKFTEAARRGGPFTSGTELGRALAFGDLDGDGDLDLVTASLSDRLRIFRNDAPARHWLRVRAVTGKRDALGAVVTLEVGGTRRSRHVLSAYSYAAASEAVAHFGLGESPEVSLLEVSWPDGAIERFPPPRVDRLVTVRRGEGTPAPRS